MTYLIVAALAGGVAAGNGAESHAFVQPNLAGDATVEASLGTRNVTVSGDVVLGSVLVATANPFNQQAAKELAESTPNRLLWYLVPPADLVKNLRKVFR